MIRQVLQGTISAFPNATLANVDVHEEGFGRAPRFHRYCVLHVRLPDSVAARYPAVQVVRSDMRGALWDLGDHRGVELESSVLTQRLELSVSPDQDDIALRELFTPTLIDALAHGPLVMWQQVRHDLVFFRDGRPESARELDHFVASADVVVRRYLEEWR